MAYNYLEILCLGCLTKTIVHSRHSKTKIKQGKWPKTTSVPYLSTHSLVATLAGDSLALDDFQ